MKISIQTVNSILMFLDRVEVKGIKEVKLMYEAIEELTDLAIAFQEQELQEKQEKEI